MRKILAILCLVFSLLTTNAVSIYPGGTFTGYKNGEVKKCSSLFVYFVSKNDSIIFWHTVKHKQKDKLILLEKPHKTVNGKYLVYMILIVDK